MRFRTTLQQSDGNATGIVVPAEVVESPICQAEVRHGQ